jgi:hypothetical protein
MVFELFVQSNTYVGEVKRCYIYRNKAVPLVLIFFCSNPCTPHEQSAARWSQDWGGSTDVVQGVQGKQGG